MSLATPPEQGQIVEVRHQRYVVADVAKNTLVRNPLEPSFTAVQHLLSLASVEDDALGEELHVIWELEPDTHVHDQRALPAPTGFDRPDRLDAFLNALRWGAASSADVRALQAPFRSGIAIEDYQLDPVVGAIQMPRQFGHNSGRVQAALEARAKERAESLQHKLDKRREQEISDIRRILEEVGQAIKKELAEAEKPEQLRLDLFNEAERDQYGRNIDALRARLAQIPHELELETSSIYARYADSQSRLFPVAVMFLVPEHLAN
jgi:hypothetical protein